MFQNIWKIKKAKTGRCSSWQQNGKNDDWWPFQPGEGRVIADIKGPGKISHIWMTTGMNYREVLIKITFDDAPFPSVLVPIGDFFCLGHGMVNSFQSFLFSASTAGNNKYGGGVALNCYAPMPFKKRAVVELINESKTLHRQYFYVDYEQYETEAALGEDMGYFHAEFRRENPFGGWAHEISVNTPEANIPNLERLAWENNYVILETKGRGHYIGCNYSVSNFQGTWWGEGDDMIWVDGYKWPPDLHGTGSEDYLNQAWGMQRNAFMRNGSSIFERDTNGYQTSYVFHLENPVRFEKEIKVTIEFGHGNHLRNEVSTVAYWYADKPTQVKNPSPVEKRMPVLQKDGEWVFDPENQITTREVPITDEMMRMKRRWKSKSFPGHFVINAPLVKLDENILGVKMALSRDNPTIYDVPLEELVEDYLDKPIVLDIVGQRSYGKFSVDQQGNLQFVDQDGKNKLLGELFGTVIAKEVELEGLLALEEEYKQAYPAEYVINVLIKKD
jgi:hypothetical protein